MRRTKYASELKDEAVKQVVVRVSKSRSGFTQEGSKTNQKSSITSRVSTIEFDAISISISLAPMSSSASVELRYKKCLQVWRNATRME